MKRVMRRFIDERYEHMSTPLKNFVKNGGLELSGDVNWSAGGCYKLNFGDTGELSGICLTTTNESVPVPPGNGINRKWVLVDNFDMFNAAVKFCRRRSRLSSRIR